MNIIQGQGPEQYQAAKDYWFDLHILHMISITSLSFNNLRIIKKTFDHGDFIRLVPQLSCWKT